MPFAEGDDAWLIVASANGAARHAAWLDHLAAHPDRVEIEFEGRKTAVTPQTLSGMERATAWGTRPIRELPIVRGPLSVPAPTVPTAEHFRRRRRGPRSSRHDSASNDRARQRAVIRPLIIAQRAASGWSVITLALRPERIGNNLGRDARVQTASARSDCARRRIESPLMVGPGKSRMA